MINSSCPDLQIDSWINTHDGFQPDQNKVTLIRWWTDGCTFCKNTAPALNDLHSNYKDQGLQILGIYHPKPVSRDVHSTQVSWHVSQKEFEFPIGIDNDWDNLNRWWLKRVSSNWTSISFLIDKKGIIRYIHPGGEFHESGGPQHEKCNKEYIEINQLIESLLAE